MLFVLTQTEVPSPFVFARAVVEPECDKSSATTYFWYRQTLNTTSSIAESGGLNIKMTLSLLVAWIIVCLAVIKGIASSGKVVERPAEYEHRVFSSPECVFLRFFHR